MCFAVIHLSVMSVSPVINLSLNVSKTVCSSKATERNVCKVNSVSQLDKPSIVNKPVY